MDVEHILEYEPDAYRTPVADHLLAVLLDPELTITVAGSGRLREVARPEPLRALLVELLTRMRLGMEVRLLVAGEQPSGVLHGE